MNNLPKDYIRTCLTCRSLAQLFNFIGLVFELTNLFWRSAGNIHTNISEPVFYQPKLEVKNKKALHEALRTVAS